MSPDATIRRHRLVVYRELPEGGGLMHLETGSFYALNTTGALIWDLVDDGITFDELVEALESSLATPPPDLVGEVTAFLDEMLDRQLVEVLSPSS
jgi:hypothetical protein